MRSNKELSAGFLHRVPEDLRKKLNNSKASILAWHDITPLARNEWICWVISAKKGETRERRITRTISELTQDKRRPCCFAGCTHRK